MTQFDALIATLADDAAPVRPQSTQRGRIILAAIAAATLALASLLLGVRDDLAEPLTGLTFGLLLLVAIAAGASAVRMARPQVGAASSGAPWALAALLLLPAIVVVQVAANPALVGGLSLSLALRCLLVGTAASLGALLFLIIWLRRGAPVAPGRASWLAGLSAGAIGALAVTLECPEEAFAHLGVWHVAIPLITGGAARLLFPRFLRW